VKKILVDARMYGLEHAGIGRYITNLLRELKKTPLADRKQFQFTLLVSKNRLKEIRKELGNFYSYQSTTAKHYSFSEQWRLLLEIKKINPDLVHFPHFNLPVFYSGKYLVTIHDLIKHFFRGKETTTKNPFFYWPKYFSYKLLIRQAVKRATAIIVPTYWWKRKLVSVYQLFPEKVFVTWEGADEAFFSFRADFQKAEITLNKYRLSAKKFFIYTGSVYPHKNIKRLMEVFKGAKDKKIVLAIACSRNVFTRRLEKIVASLKLENQVKFLGFVPDKELAVLYQEAIALIQPSLMEGFGLTGLEAMACGCPVISSNTSCLPEVYGKAAIYFNPLNIKEMKEKIFLLIGDEKLRKEMINRGKKRIKGFSWQKTARKTLVIYQKILDEKKA